MTIKNHHFARFLVICLASQLMVFSLEAQMTVGDLKCEYMNNPVGIGVITPRFSWKLYSDRDNQVQTAFQVMVASSPELLKRGKTDLWYSERM